MSLRLLEDPDQTAGKPWSDCWKTLIRLLEDPDQTAGRPWSDCWKTLIRLLENLDQTAGKPWSDCWKTLIRLLEDPWSDCWKTLIRLLENPYLNLRYLSKHFGQISVRNFRTPTNEFHITTAYNCVYHTIAEVNIWARWELCTCHICVKNMYCYLIRLYISNIWLESSSTSIYCVCKLGSSFLGDCTNAQAHISLGCLPFL